MRLADVKPGDVVEYSSGFAWVMLKLEPMSRIFQWAPLPPRTDLTQMPLSPRWSPPHDEESWNATLNITIRPYRR